MRKRKRRRRGYIQGSAAGHETWQSSAGCGPTCGHGAYAQRPARRPRGDHAAHRRGGRQSGVIEPWGCFSTRYV